MCLLSLNRVGGSFMSSNHSASGKIDSKLKFDFDEWYRLSQQSPDKFELKRQQLCEQIINHASLNNQRRLRGLQFQINMNRRKSANAMDSCINISTLMWDSFYNLFDELKNLSDYPDKPASQQCQNSEQRPAPVILPFYPVR
jgi:hypothetical protein